jgi:hypothetical protein
MMMKNEQNAKGPSLYPVTLPDCPSSIQDASSSDGCNIIADGNDKVIPKRFRLSGRLIHP